MSPRPVPWAVERPDRIPKQRYFDPGFYALEAEHFWPRVWQMACRLEEIPRPGDFVEYVILDQSIIVVRTDDMEVKAYHNACRHRAVKLVEDAGTCASGFICPFHGWCFGLDGSNTYVHQPDLFAEDNVACDDLSLVSVRCQQWGGCSWINLDDDAPPLRESLEPYATYHDAWRADTLRVEWWESCLLPANWKLAMAAFMEGWHVPQTHPQLLPTTSMTVVDANLEFMRKLSVGMGGMIHEVDVRIAEDLRDLELPAHPRLAAATWRRALNDAVVRWWDAHGVEIADLNQLDALGQNAPIEFCFPNTFLLPMYSSASAYRFRPVGPEETLMEIWSLTRFPDGAVERARPTPPTPKPPDAPSWPPIPSQDFANIPKQQQGLHSRSVEFMRLAEKIEGLISNFERVVDGYLGGVPDEQLVGAMQQTNGPIDVPIAEFDFSVTTTKQCG